MSFCDSYNEPKVNTAILTFTNFSKQELSKEGIFEKTNRVTVGILELTKTERL